MLTRRSVPLSYIYPPMLHYKARADTLLKKVADIAMIVFGVVTAVYTTVQTVKVRSVQSYAVAYSLCLQS